MSYGTKVQPSPMYLDSKGQWQMRRKTKVETKTGFTKGEWKIDRDSTSDYLNLIRAGEHIIGQLSNGTSTFATVTPAEGEANSRLIAAAPDMYEALKAIQEGIKLGHELIGCGREELMNKALAKAEGKSI